MKKLFLLSLLILPVIIGFSSCDKINGGNDSDTPVITDPLIVGAWNVVKYEALDKNSKVIATENTSSVIADTYYKFVFDASGNIQCWYSVSAGQCITTDYSYFSSSGKLFFGLTGEATVSTLSDTTLVFESDSFAPLAWYDSTTGLIQSEISTVRVTCMKVTE